MVTPELLRFLFQYNLWADRRLMDVCGSLTNWVTIWAGWP